MIEQDFKNAEYYIVADGIVIQTYDNLDAALHFFKNYFSYKAYKELKQTYTVTHSLEVVIC